MAAEAEAQLEALREFELRLLRCSIPAPSPTSPFESSDDPHAAQQRHSLHTLIEEAVSLIEVGDYAGALSSDAARTIFKFAESPPSVDGPDWFYSEFLFKRVESFILDESEGEKDRCHRAFLTVVIAVAAFLAFTECNITGPSERLPSLPTDAFQDDAVGGAGGPDWEGWAQNQLMAAGSDLLGKFSNLQYIVFAKTLLMRMKDLLSEGKVSSMDGIRSISWWLARILLLQQRMLDERSSSLFDLLQVYSQETLHYFGTSEKVTDYWGSKLQEEEALTVVSMLHLEVGIMEHTYGRVDSSRLQFKSAEVASGLKLSVTGALGFRTVHQVDPKAQLLLVANTTTNNSVDSSSISTDLPRNAASMDGDNLLRHHHEAREASDVLLTPRFLEGDKGSENGAQGTANGSIAAVPLKATQQAVILAQCLSIEKSTPHDEMQRWEMAPYIEAIDSQLSSCFIIRCFCDILRIRWESTRSRTKERALLMMDKLGIFKHQGV